MKGGIPKGMIQFVYLGMTYHPTRKCLLLISHILSDDGLSLLKMMEKAKKLSRMEPRRPSMIQLLAGNYFRKKFHHRFSEGRKHNLENY